MRSSKETYSHVSFLEEESRGDKDALKRNFSDVKSPSRKRRFLDATEARGDSDCESDEVEED